MDFSGNSRLKQFKSKSIPFALLLALMAFLSYAVTAPLLRALAWTVVLSFLAYPLYTFLYKKLFRERWKNFAAGLTTMAILCFMILPMIAIVFAVTREVGSLYDVVLKVLPGVQKEGVVALLPLIPEGPIRDMALRLINAGYLAPLFSDLGRWITSFLGDISRSFIESLFKLAYQILIIMLTSFFVVRDGHVIVDYIYDILPLPPEVRKALFERACRMLQAVIYGIMLTAAVQAMLGGIGWWFVGLPDPIIFGGLMFLFAMIPFVGTPIVWFPGALYLLMTGNTHGGILLMAWGFGVVTTIDNFIRPIFISEGSKAHMLLVFIGVLGGLSTWGFLGLFLGPLVLSLFVFLLDTYRSFVLESGKSDPPRQEKDIPSS